MPETGGNVKWNGREFLEIANDFGFVEVDRNFAQWHPSEGFLGRKAAQQPFPDSSEFGIGQAL